MFERWRNKQSVRVTQFLLALKMLLKRNVRPDIKRACDLKLTWRKHSPLYEKGTQQTQNKSIETTGGNKYLILLESEDKNFNILLFRIHKPKLIQFLMKFLTGICQIAPIVRPRQFLLQELTVQTWEDCRPLLCRLFSPWNIHCQSVL